MPQASVPTPSATPATSGRERRIFPRIEAHQLAAIAMRLANGAEVRLVDLSRTGARLETDRRMLPNSTIAVKLVTADSSFLVSGLVVRSRVIRLTQGGLGYDVAISFSQTLHQLEDLPADDGDVSQGAEAPEPVPGDDASAPWTDPMIHVTANVEQSSQDVMAIFSGSGW
jgi:hypothetical protein